MDTSPTLERFLDAYLSLSPRARVRVNFLICGALIGTAAKQWLQAFTLATGAVTGLVRSTFAELCASCRRK